MRKITLPHIILLTPFLFMLTGCYIIGFAIDHKIDERAATKSKRENSCEINIIENDKNKQLKLNNEVQHPTYIKVLSWTKEATTI